MNKQTVPQAVDGCRPEFRVPGASSRGGGRRRRRYC